MSEIGSLSRLRKGWALARDEDGARWRVVILSDSYDQGDFWSVIGQGETVNLAIDAAEAYAEEEARRWAAWEADREERRARGGISPADFYVPTIWATEIVKAASSPSSILKTKSEPQA